MGLPVSINFHKKIFKNNYFIIKLLIQGPMGMRGESGPVGPVGKPGHPVN